MKEGDQNPAAARTDRMPERDRAAVRIDSLIGDPELLDDGERLGGERLVQLVQVDIRELQSRLGERLADGWNRADAHDPRLDANRRVALNGAERLEATLARRARRHHYGGRRAVVHARRISGGHLSVLPAERGPQFRERLSGRSGARVLVDRDDATAALLRDLDWDDLMFENALLDGPLSLELALGGELVLLLAGDPIPVGEVLRGDAHVDV